jgi:hypothetical protein
MFKAELKERWGMYCDTDKLVTDMMELLNKYEHDCTENGVCTILDKYFTNKKPLIDMFLTSESYIGNMRICIDVEMERNSNPTEIQRFCENFPDNVNAREIFYKYVDENGKTLKDYSRVGVRRFKARHLCYGDIGTALADNIANRKKFHSSGVTIESSKAYDDFWGMIYGFRHSPSANLASPTVAILTEYKINGRFVAGMKTSRAFNRVCSIYGVDKLPNYNKMFAEYADMVSNLKRKMKFYISLNPLDYLTMSFGNSWSSCHTIDKRNKRGMPNSYSGMHCGGTMSYMLDGTSIITYVHDHATEDHEEGRFYRNMFHFNNGTLIQGRVYPQGNDGATDLYKTFRRFMQIELTKLLGLNADDWLKRTTSCCENVASYGVHYRDYEHFGDCNVSYPREMPSAASNIVRVGHSRICPWCGYEVSDNDDSGYLHHEDCDAAAEDRENDDDDAWA